MKLTVISREQIVKIPMAGLKHEFIERDIPESQQYTTWWGGGLAIATVKPGGKELNKVPLTRSRVVTTREAANCRLPSKWLADLVF